MVTNLRAPYEQRSASLVSVAGNKVRGQRIFETIGLGERAGSISALERGAPDQI